MQKRVIKQNEIHSNKTMLENMTARNPEHKVNYMTIAANFFPVDSAIVMRDTKSQRQVTLMNDRAQAGTADLTQNSTIELIQNRRYI